MPQGVLVHAGISSLFVAKFALFIACFLSWIIVCGRLFKYICFIPTIAGQIIGGVLLGPSLINIVSVPFFAEPFVVVDKATGLAYSLVSSDLFVFFLLLLSAAFTVSYLLWLAGYETNVYDIISMGITPICAGIFGAILSIILIAGLLICFLSSSWTLIQALSIGVILAATSVSIPIAMLFALNKMHLKSSKATLGAAIIDDIFGIILLSVFFLAVQSGVFGGEFCQVAFCHNQSLLVSCGYMLAGLLIVWVGGYVCVPRLIHFLQRKKLYELIAPVANIIMLIAFSFLELFAGLAGITGAYFAGLFQKMGDVRHNAEKSIAPFVNAVLLPLFLGSIGLQVDVSVLSLHDWYMAGIILFLAAFAKIAGCLLATMMSNMSGRQGVHRWSSLETYLFGSSMVARGEVGLVVSTIVYGAGFIELNQYVIGVVVIVGSTIVSSIMLSLGFSYLEKHQQQAEGNKVEYAVAMGPFPAIGTMQMFNIIIGQLKVLGLYQSLVEMSEGRKAITLEGQRVRIIMRPGRDITFMGDKTQVIEIVRAVKSAIVHDIDRMIDAKSEN